MRHRQHFADRLAGDFFFDVEAALFVGIEKDVHFVHAAEEIVDVAHDVLIGAGEEHAEVIGLVGAQLVEGKGFADVIQVDVSNLNIGDSIHVREIQLPEGVKTTVSPDLTAFSVLAPTVEEEPVVAEVEAAAGPEVIREKKEEPEAATAAGAKDKAAPKEKEQKK